MLPPREEATNATLRRRVALRTCVDERRQLLHLVGGRGAVGLGLGIVAQRGGIGEVDGEQLVALVAVGLEAPDVVDPQRARIAVAVHEHHRRRTRVGRRRRAARRRWLLGKGVSRPQRGRPRQQRTSCRSSAPQLLSPGHRARMLANQLARRYARLMAICYIESPVGRLALEADGDALSVVRWASPGERARAAKVPPILREAERQLKRYFAGRLKAFDLKLAARGTDFQKRVWKMMSDIPYGETATYGGMAMALGSGPRAGRHGLRAQSAADHRALPSRAGAAAAAKAAIRAARACPTKHKLLALEGVVLL